MIILALRLCFNARSLGSVFAVVGPPSSHFFHLLSRELGMKYRDFGVHLEDCDCYEEETQGNALRCAPEEREFFHASYRRGGMYG